MTKEKMSKIINKRVIVYINNDNLIHWTCTFIFNMMSYIAKWEYKQLAKTVPNGQELQNDVFSGYFQYDPFAKSDQPLEISASSGVLDF